MSYNRPRQEGLDDETGEPLTKRPDDNPEVFARRLAQFYESTSPLLKYFAESSDASPTGEPKLVTMRGFTSDEIWPKLEGFVKSSFPGIRERAETRAVRMRHSLSDALLSRDSSALASQTGRAMMEAWAAAGANKSQA